jgi:glycosyltransferase involved in cell wall biosynthesis
MKPKKVLFAHQSTIPHYRVEFYNYLKKYKSEEWDFHVVFDKKTSRDLYFAETDSSRFEFETLPTKTWTIKLFNRSLRFQNFFFKAHKYDLIIVGSALDNPTYALIFLYKLLGKKIAIWGQGKDTKERRKDALAPYMEKFRIFLSNIADGFFAYNNMVYEWLVSKNIDKDKITVIYNAVNTVKHRQFYNEIKNKRDEIRAENGFSPNDKVLLYMGRMIMNKKVDFILETYEYLRKKDASYKLMLIGSSKSDFLPALRARFGEEDVIYKGFVPDTDIPPYFVLSDLFVFPGAVGLGLVQPVCYNLVPIIIESPLHSVEIEYFNNKNVIALPEGTNPKEYSDVIEKTLSNTESFAAFRETVYDTIKYITIENMVKNYAGGIDRILNIKK